MLPPPQEKGAQLRIAVKGKVQVKVVGRHCAFYTRGAVKEHLAKGQNLLAQWFAFVCLHS